MRGRQRALRGRQAGHQQPARQPGHRDRGPDQGAGLMPRDPKQKVHKDFNEGIYHRPPTGPSFLSVGSRRRDRPRGDPHLFGVHQVAAVTAPRLHGHGDLRECGNAALVVTGTDRRRQRRRGDLGSSATATSPRHLHGRRRRPADQGRTPRSRSARASSSRATSSSTCRPGSPSARALPDGGAIPVTRTLDRRPARSGPHHSAAAGPPQPQRPARRLQIGARRSADPRPGQGSGSRSVQGESAAEAINELVPLRRPGRRGTAQVSEALLGERPGDLTSDRLRPGRLPQARLARVAAELADHQLLDYGRRTGRRVRRASRRRSLSWRRPSSGRSRRSRS